MDNGLVIPLILGAGSLAELLANMGDGEWEFDEKDSCAFITLEGKIDIVIQKER